MPLVFITIREIPPRPYNRAAVRSTIASIYVRRNLMGYAMRAALEKWYLCYHQIKLKKIKACVIAVVGMGKERPSRDRESEMRKEGAGEYKKKQ